MQPVSGWRESFSQVHTVHMHAQMYDSFYENMHPVILCQNIICLGQPMQLARLMPRHAESAL